VEATVKLSARMYPLSMSKQIYACNTCPSYVPGVRSEAGDFSESTVKLFGKDVPYEEVLREVEAVDGVLAAGLFVGAATAVVVADPKGPITYVQV
jgi:hypothetical protein